MGQVQTNFRAQDFVKSGSKTSKAAAKKAAAKKAEPKQADSNEVPEGTSEEVVAWVGKNANKARRALAAEKKDGSPRKSLTASLEKVINDERDTKKVAAEKKDRDGNSS